ncbi:MAG: cell envelope integrity protein CreD [Holophagaceae bacterium]|nr:cell envelope integrity protein CreD [Holophagaceae bacterium]
MKREMLWKALAVGGLALLLLLPLSMIEGLVSARSRRQKEVEANIAQTSADRQQLVGPLLALDYTAKQTSWVPGEKGEKGEKGFWQEKEISASLLLPPRKVLLEGKVQVEERYRGLYKAQLFHLEGRLQGEVDIPLRPTLPSGLREVSWGKARLLFAVSDLRGLQSHPQLQWGKGTVDFRLAEAEPHVGRGLEAELGPVSELMGTHQAFQIPLLKLLGTQEFSVAPVAEDTQVHLSSNWASPSFAGRFLPERRTITPGGFDAHWQVAGLARDLNAILDGRGRSEEVFSVSFLEPVNIYLQAERATKYGFLFVGLVFAAFFFFEVLKRLPIHPMQYLLVGLSLALFFLLLLSLSEHLPFLWAYVSASVSSVLLLGFYLMGVLRSWIRSLGFAAAMALLYGVLYGLLASEDNALLMGSALLFAVLAGVMAATRRVDWYGLGQGTRTSE